MFVVVGNQRTGTNILREILNTNEEIAMLGEIFMPSAAPAHFENFLCDRPYERDRISSTAELDVMMDRYFDFVCDRVRNHWASGLKRHVAAIGVDVKYSQLRYFEPHDWPGNEMPYLLHYFLSRNVTLVHMVRRNVIRCAVSLLIAVKRDLWHNYAGTSIDGSYRIDVAACIAYARTIARERDAFLSLTEGTDIVTSYYHELSSDIARAAHGGTIPEQPGALCTIARALDVPFQFQYDGSLRKAIDLPYARVISNYDELLAGLKSSEFAEYVTAMDE